MLSRTFAKKIEPMYRILIRPILFFFKPETIHHLTFSILRIPFLSKLMKVIYSFEDKRLERTVFGLTFKNPIGLAAGFDKDALGFKQLSDLGFGFVEIGTLTPRGQPGNPKPRLFRLKEDSAIINRMGFNNNGVDIAVERLAKNKNVLIGGNIGKNKITPNENAVDDYTYCFHALYDVVDYFVVNVSSPNTPNLRELQDKEPLQKLLTHLQSLNNDKPKQKPILLKIAPDLTNEQLDDIVSIISESNISGVIATNTTISRADLITSDEAVEAIGAGGLSGKPVRSRSTEVIKYLHDKSNGSFPIIGVGGIHSAKDAIEKLNAGASLIQLYTGFIYEGPALIKSIKKELLKQN